MGKPQRRRTNDPQSMRARILDAAADLFLSKGYHATTTQDVTAQAGVTSGALHHHFPTKKALGLAVIEDRIAAQVTATWIDPLEAAPDAVAGIRLVFDQIASGLGEQGYVRGCPLNNLGVELAYAEADFRAPIRAVYSQWRSRVADRLRAAQADGWRRDLDPATTADLVIATYAGAMTLAKVEQSPQPLAAAGAALCEQLAGR